MIFKHGMTVGCLKHGVGQISEILTSDEGDVTIVVNFPYGVNCYRKDGRMLDHTDYEIPHLHPIEQYLKIQTICLDV